MKFAKRTLAFSTAAGIMLFTTGCADDNLSKGLVTVGGAVGGAFLGSQLAGPGNKVGGAILGAGAGGALGFLLGGMIGKK